LENTEENSEKIWKMQKKIVKRYGKYGKKVSWIVKRHGKHGRKESWNRKRFLENMEENQVE